MVTLTNPVTPQNIVDRFADFVLAAANTGVVWGTNTLPFVEMPGATYAGTTSGTSITATGATIGTTGNTITAATIRSVLETETALYTNIRQQRAILNVTGAGGNTGTRPTAGVIFDDTQVAHLDTSNRAAIGAVADANVTTGQTVDDTNLETYFTNLTAAYTAIRTTTVTTQIDVCHASCHSSCHSSRGRR
jgi:hypothetical protein